MKEINEEARDRYYDEVGIHLTRAGFSVLPKENGLLPLEWNGASLCRITAGGGAQFRAEELEPEGASDAFRRATGIAETTAEYMRHMEAAPPLQAQGLEATTVSSLTSAAQCWLDIRQATASSSSLGSGTISTQECGRVTTTAITTPGQSRTSPSAQD